MKVIEIKDLYKIYNSTEVKVKAVNGVTIDFEEGTDIYWARQQVAERLNSIWADLPEGVTGGIAPMTTPLGEIFMFSIEGGDLNLMERLKVI